MAPKSVSPIVAAEADQFEAALKAARIPDQLTDGMWDIWTASPARAHSLIARFTGVAIGQQVAAKLKQAALDPVEAAGARFIAALRAKLPDDAAIAYLDRQTQALQGASSGGRSTLTSSGAQSVATKTARRDPIAQALMGDLRSDMIPR